MPSPLPKGPGHRFQRVEVHEAVLGLLAHRALDLGLSVAAYARVALDLLARTGVTDDQAIRAEAERIRAVHAPPPKPARPPRPRGRPRKHAATG